MISEYNIYYAVNGQEALDKLLSIPKPDIIISDIMMEIMDGHEFFNKIGEKEGYNDIPFIFLSSRNSWKWKWRKAEPCS
ncbi:MAG: response regulator [Spirochaetales bacterium]|nr:response regulator [Spirochaetales bacterium]